MPWSREYLYAADIQFLSHASKLRADTPAFLIPSRRFDICDPYMILRMGSKFQRTSTVSSGIFEKNGDDIDVRGNMSSCILGKNTLLHSLRQLLLQQQIITWTTATLKTIH